MSASNFRHPGRFLAAPAVVLLLAACGSSGGDGGPDTRCFGVAQVPGWQVHVTSSFADQGNTDTLSLSLHATLDATGQAGPVQASSINNSGYSWFAGLPTGTFAGRDTVISITADTIVSTATQFGKGPGKSYGPYVSVNLATCQASLGAVLFSVVSVHNSKTGTVLDTIFAAYPVYSGLTIDSLAVANGWTLPAAKYASALPSASFPVLGGQYRAGGSVDPYVAAGSADLDSATVSWTVTPLASFPAPGTAAPR